MPPVTAPILVALIALILIAIALGALSAHLFISASRDSGAHK